MNQKSLRWVAILLIAILMLVACAPAAAPTEEAAEPTEAATEMTTAEATDVATAEPTAEVTEAPTAEPTEAVTGDPIKIGVMQDLTGGLQLFGNEALNGFKLGLEYATGGDMIVNGHPIELVEKDDTGVPEVAASAAKELIESDGVDILVGNSSSAAALQVQQIAADNEIVYMAGPAAAHDITGKNWNEYTFRACRDAIQDSLVIMPWAMENVGKNYVILAEDYAFGQQTAAGFKAQIEAFGGTVMPDGEPIFAPSDTTDFTPYIQKILDNKPDGIVLVWATNTSSTVLFQQLQDQGVTGTIPFITGFSANPLTAQLDPGFIGSTGLIVYHYSLPQTKANDWLVEHHKAEYNSNPDLFTECGFATAQALVEGLKNSDGDPSAEALIPALEGVTFEGPKGTYTIRPEDHQALAPGYVVKLTSVDDPDEKYFELVEEIPADKIAPPCDAPNCPPK